jgi:Na+/H+-dicarboxylate symporter
MPMLDPAIYQDLKAFIELHGGHGVEYFIAYAEPLTRGGGYQIWLEVLKVGKYSLTVLTGLAIHAFIILPLVLSILARRNPLKYAYGVIQAVATAFSTASSSATLPITIDAAVKNNKVNSKAASFVLPLGATINMDGTALYEAVAAIFIAQLYGVDLSFAQQVIIVLTATLAAVGAAGIPQAGLVTMVIVLQSVNLPVEGIASILAVDWLLDRFRTAVNVWGDSVGAAVIERTSEISSP